MISYTKTWVQEPEDKYKIMNKISIHKKQGLAHTIAQVKTTLSNALHYVSVCSLYTQGCMWLSSDMRDGSW